MAVQWTFANNVLKSYESFLCCEFWTAFGWEIIWKTREEVISISHFIFVKIRFEPEPDSWFILNFRTFLAFVILTNGVLIKNQTNSGSSYTSYVTKPDEFYIFFWEKKITLLVQYKNVLHKKSTLHLGFCEQLGWHE